MIQRPPLVSQRYERQGALQPLSSSVNLRGRCGSSACASLAQRALGLTPVFATAATVPRREQHSCRRAQHESNGYLGRKHGDRAASVGHHGGELRESRAEEGEGPDLMPPPAARRAAESRDQAIQHGMLGAAALFSSARVAFPPRTHAGVTRVDFLLSAARQEP